MEEGQKNIKTAIHIFNSFDISCLCTFKMTYFYTESNQIVTLELCVKFLGCNPEERKK